MPARCRLGSARMGGTFPGTAAVALLALNPMSCDVDARAASRLGGSGRDGEELTQRRL